jgi:simple sugar transport system permease protein
MISAIKEKMRSNKLFPALIGKFLFNLQRILPQIIALLLAFLTGAIILVATGYSPIDAYGAMFIGAFGDITSIGLTFSKATPIIFTALSFLFAFKSGLFNIGAEGQLLIGGFAAALVGISFNDLPSFIHVPLALIAAALAGGLWGFLPAVLKVWFGAHEVITTMMLSYVALYFTSYLVNYPFKAPGWVPQTIPVSQSAELPRLLQASQVSAAIILALLLVALTWYIFQKTSFGYEIRAIGLNSSVAENAGINIKRGMIFALIISGATAGLGGAGEILGVHRRFIDGFSPGYGWDGLAVALVGGLHPVGVLMAAVMFGALRNGGMTMSRTAGVPLDIIFLIQALVILYVAAPELIRFILRRGRLK